MAGDDDYLPPWQWPGRWFRDETFWRQVATSTLAAFIFGVAGFLAARLAGFFAQVPWSVVWRMLATGTLLLPAIAVVMALVAACLVTIDRITRKRLIRRGNDLLAKLKALREEIDELPDMDGRS
ncbi:hypothetical protein [Mycobacterium intracellulare]|uniref:hypothetical protein n=1 Tax=Mycobacterium intracellulare TaxID=1767 RepID=UPI00115529C7|nr:hypothetical protein [Mycobacterium intracellulare]MCA2231120.1 hypothetical protein [Mycobacterium intracellulare]